MQKREISYAGNIIYGKYYIQEKLYTVNIVYGKYYIQEKLYTGNIIYEKYYIQEKLYTGNIIYAPCKYEMRRNGKSCSTAVNNWGEILNILIEKLI